MHRTIRDSVGLRTFWAVLLLWIGLFAPAAFAQDKPAPAPSPTPSRKLVVGFSQVGAESSWRTAESKSIKDEAAKRGVDLKFADAQGKQSAQIRAIKSFITQKVDVIVLAPSVETGWEAALGEAKEAKIPVILVDRGIKTADESLYATLIASDFVEEGRTAAEWLAKATGGKATIVELQGSTGAAPAIDRQKGFAEGIAKHPEMKIVKSQSGDFNLAKGKEVMAAFLKAQGGQGADARKITAVYAHNDDMALGAIQAIEEAGMKPGTDITIVSIDGVKGAFEAMVGGKLNATVECSPLLGPMVFDAAEKAVKGEKLPRFIKQNDRLFTRETAKADIGSRQY